MSMAMKDVEEIVKAHGGCIDTNQRGDLLVMVSNEQTGSKILDEIEPVDDMQLWIIPEK